MQIENAEALRIWLAAFLEPLCDADPVALSKYVIALVKKDKDEGELRTSMTEQMNVFLQKATGPFIDHLFKALESKEYLQGPPTHPLVPDVLTTDEKEEAEAAARVKGEPKDSEAGEKQPADSTTPVREGGATSHADEGRAERRDTERYRRGEGYERSRRRSSRSPRRFSRRSPNGRRYRAGSPRGRSRSRSPVFRRLSRRSPYRGRSRSRSVSPTYKRRDSRGSTPIRDEDAANPYSSAAAASSSAPGAGPSPHKRPRCRDYDEKGFCMRGDQCKFDHGNDAVVLEDATGVPPYQPVGGATAYAEPYVPAGSSSLPLPPLNVPPPGYNPTPSTAYPLAAVSGPPAIPRKRSFDPTLEDTSYPPNKMSAFNRLGPAGGAVPPRGGFRGGYRGRGRGGRGSKQIAVRNVPPQVNNIAHLNNHFAKFGNLVNVQIQFEGDPASALVTFSSPAEAESAFNSAEAVLGNRFIKMYYHYERPSPQAMRGGFQGGRGNIKERLGASATDESVKYEGDILTKTISNAPEKTEEEKQAEAQQKSEEKAAAIEAIKQNQQMLEAKAVLKKEAEEKRAEQLKKAKEIQKSKQGLLEKLIEEQKKLILKVEEAKKPEEKAELMKLVKSLSASIDKAREDVKRAVSSAAVQRKSPAELQKELLDAELELIQAEQDGSEAQQEVQKKVNRLRIEAAKLGVLATSRGRGRGFGGSPRGFMMRGGRGGFFGGPRGVRGGRYVRRGGRFVYQGATIDRRPTKILVTGYTAEEKEELVAHFQKFGEMSDPVDNDGEAPSIVINFKYRQEAELAMAGGKGFKDKSLDLSWFIPPPGSVEFETPEASAGANDGSPNSSLLLSPSAGGEGANVGVSGEEEDDYTPLDPAYLPPGLDEDGEDKENLETSNDEVNQLLYDEDESHEAAEGEGDVGAQEEAAKPDDEEEEEVEDEGERSWKR